MSVPVTMLLAPGRGSYAKEELGSLAARVAEAGAEGRALIGDFEALRRELDPGLPSLLELDGAAAFRPGLHLPGRNASPLIYACGILESLAHRQGGGRVDLVAGNSLGFYTALALSGALDPLSGYRLVSTMARLQEEGPEGGQLLWTLLDEDWQLVAERQAQLEVLLEDPDVDLSIRLGGHVVLAGDEAGLARAQQRLPEARLGKRSFPFRLPFHGPFHTPLLEPVAERAALLLRELPFGRPRCSLIDGRGYEWSPLSTDPEALRVYTLGHQVTRAFDFTAMVEVALRDFGPEEIRLLGPGNSLRAPLGHVQGWCGISV